jgi:hypothetical protein
VLSQGAQDLLDVLQMFFLGPTEYEDVIQIYDHKRVCEWPQDIIHHPHECHWSISQAKRHDQPFKKAFFRFEGCFPYISLFYQNLVVARLQINLTKELGTLKLIKKIINLGDQVSVLDNDLVQGSIINTESPCPILLLYQHNWAPTR